MYKYNYSISTCFREGTDFLEEWIEHHLRLGIEHFFLYDNCTKKNYSHIIEKYKDFITLNYFELDIIKELEDKSGNTNSMKMFWEHPNNPQKNYLEKYLHLSKWTFMLDIDEYLNTFGKPLDEIMLKYEGYDQIIIRLINCSFSTALYNSKYTRLLSRLSFKDILNPNKFSNKCVISKNCKFNLSPHLFKSETIHNTDGKQIICKDILKETTSNNLIINHLHIRDLDSFKNDKINLYLTKDQLNNLVNGKILDKKKYDKRSYLALTRYTPSFFCYFTKCFPCNELNYLNLNDEFNIDELLKEKFLNLKFFSEKHKINIDFRNKKVFTKSIGKCYSIHLINNLENDEYTLNKLYTKKEIERAINKFGGNKTKTELAYVIYSLINFIIFVKNIFFENIEKLNSEKELLYHAIELHKSNLVKNI